MSEAAKRAFLKENSLNRKLDFSKMSNANLLLNRLKPWILMVSQIKSDSLNVVDVQKQSVIEQFTKSYMNFTIVVKNTSLKMPLKMRRLTFKVKFRCRGQSKIGY